MKNILGIMVFALIAGMMGAWENGAITFHMLLLQVTGLLGFVAAVQLVTAAFQFLRRVRCAKKRKQKLA